MNKQFLAAALGACTLLHVKDPSTQKMGWLARCDTETGKKVYIGKFPKRQRGAKNNAKQFLEAHRPRQYTVSAKELGYVK